MVADEFAPYDSNIHGFSFHIVRSKGDAELGNWLVASFRWREERDRFLQAVSLRVRGPTPVAHDEDGARK